MTQRVYGSRHPLSETIDIFYDWLYQRSFKELTIDISKDASDIYDLTGIKKNIDDKMQYGVSIERSLNFTWKCLEGDTEKRGFSIGDAVFKDCQQAHQLDVIFLDDSANVPMAKRLIFDLCGVAGIGENIFNIKPIKIGHIGPAFVVDFNSNIAATGYGKSKDGFFGIAGVIRPELWESRGHNPDSLGICLSFNLNMIIKRTKLH